LKGIALGGARHQAPLDTIEIAIVVGRVVYRPAGFHQVFQPEAAKAWLADDIAVVVGTTHDETQFTLFGQVVNAEAKAGESVCCGYLVIT